MVAAVIDVVAFLAMYFVFDISFWIAFIASMVIGGIIAFFI